MHPEAKKLADENYEEVLRIILRTVYGPFIYDRDMIVSIVGQSICEAAEIWVEEELEGPFGRWAYRYAQRRIIDEWRLAYGRTQTSRRLDYRAHSLDADTLLGSIYYEILNIPDYHTKSQTEITEDMNAEWFWEKVKPRFNEQEEFVITNLASGRTLLSIGEELGLTEARICQIRKSVKKKLSHMRESLFAS